MDGHNHAVESPGVATVLAAPKRGSLGSDLGEGLQWAVVLLAGLMLLAFQAPGAHQDAIREITRVFLSIVLEALPFMLLGSLVGGLIEVFVSGEKLSALLSGRRKRTVLIAAAMGMVFPVCECAVVPVVRRLLRKGIPVSAAIAYLLAGPIVNPIVAASTLVAYRYKGAWGVLAARFGLGYAIAVGIGLLIGWLFKDQKSLLAGEKGDFLVFPESGDAVGKTTTMPERPSESTDRENLNVPFFPVAADPGKRGQARLPKKDSENEPVPFSNGHEHDHVHGHEDDDDEAEPVTIPLHRRLADAVGHAADDFMDIGRFLVIGALIAGCLRGAIDQRLFVAIAGRPAVAIPAMMAFAFALTLCSEADAFVAASFRGLVPWSAQIAFLILGPMLDVKLLLMYTKLFRKRALAVLTVSILLAVLIAATLCKLLGGDGR